MKKSKIAAIIPAFNEQKSIANVVRVAKNSGFFDEVIVISDGSTDKTKDRAMVAGATLVHNLRLKKGKGAAMLHGVTHTDAEIIVFLDADLKGLKKEHIKQLIDPVWSGKTVMTVGIRDRGKILSCIATHMPLIGGERAMQRFVIENIPPNYLQGFMAEAALNYYCRSRKLKYGTVFLSGLHIIRKMQKVGVLRGLLQYIKMSYTVVKAMFLVRLARLRGRF